MEKPVWRVRSSSYVIDSSHMRLRKDEIELPDGTIVPDYYVRESRGFAIVVALTDADEVVLIRQYRYGPDALVLEFPAGSIDGDEPPLECARRELREETGYEAERFALLATPQIDPVRSNALAYVYLARGAQRVSRQNLEATEYIEVVTVPRANIHGMLRDGSIPWNACIAAGYLALDALADATREA